jgi:hypothetical protein
MGYWPMDGNAQDYSGNGNHGTVFNAVPTADRFGNPNMAYYFNGINANIVVNNSPTIDIPNNTDFSVCFWIQIPANPNTDALPLSKNLNGYWSSYAFLTNSSNPGYCNTPGCFSFYTASGAFQDAGSNNPIALGGATNENGADKWYFITGVYDAVLNQSNLYIDAVLQNDIGSSSGNISNSVNLFFGSHTTNQYYFKGSLDGIRIYKTKLTPAQIDILYNETITTTDLGKNNSELQNISIFPNPSKDVMNVSFYSPMNDNVNIKMTDQLGKVVLILNVEVVAGLNKVPVYVKDLADGIYILQLMCGDKMMSEKISVFH